MSHDLIRLMHVFFLPGAESQFSPPWRPNMDVYRCGRDWLVKFELAGVRTEDIELEALGSQLALRGVRRDRTGCWLPGRNLTQHQMEIAYSRFERVIELPCDLQAADITTEYRDGLLLVHIVPAQPGAGYEEGTRP